MSDNRKLLSDSKRIEAFALALQICELYRKIENLHLAENAFNSEYYARAAEKLESFANRYIAIRSSSSAENELKQIKIREAQILAKIEAQKIAAKK